ncbi:IS630 family transposase [Agrobacterium rhizogenes]|nr:IS630 family transposase [Rhizobium rhizogenes]NTI75953.1 IS630 family transposase [Rhizobium rhizogenes]NTJ02479.1 IS630 family transposase [Rhizobium rhizogenes]NTJ49060.1 IS630 family transposase [Rhizobium rhizogenes]
MRILKKFPCRSGGNCRRHRQKQKNRNLVPGRGSHRPEEQDHAPLGQTRNATSAPHDQRTRSAYIFGAICPKHGKAAALVMPWCDTHAMTQHLAEIARHVAEDAHAILIMDQAGWHMSKNLVVPENITILPLPPKSPELNPVENLWHFMRDNWLSNRVFKSYDDIVAHCKPMRFNPAAPANDP